jgi:hypothetical protein
MNGGVAPVALVAVLLVLAGCGGAPTGPAGGTATDEDAVGTPTVTATATESPPAATPGSESTATPDGTTTAAGTVTAGPTRTATADPGVVATSAGGGAGGSVIGTPGGPAGADSTPADASDGAPPRSVTATPSMASPPGTGPEGVTDAAALFEAHQDGLTGTDYAVAYGTRSVVAGNRSEVSTVVRSDRDRERTLERTGVPGAAATLETFRNRSGFFRREAVDDRIHYTVRDPGLSFRAAHRQRADARYPVETVLRYGEFERTGTATHDGRRVTRFGLAAVNRSALSAGTTVTEASGALLVDRQGVVRRALVDIRGERDGTDRRLVAEYRVVETGEVTVTPPDWLDEATAASGR